MTRWLLEITWERALATGSNDIDVIYHRMAVIRRELHSNVRESVAGAEAFVDWGRYTWTYPWVGLGAAAAVGYVLYKGSHQKAATDATTGRRDRGWWTSRGSRGQVPLRDR